MEFAEPHQYIQVLAEKLTDSHPRIRAHLTKTVALAAPQVRAGRARSSTGGLRRPRAQYCDSKNQYPPYNDQSGAFSPCSRDGHTIPAKDIDTGTAPAGSTWVRGLPPASLRCAEFLYSKR